MLVLAAREYAQPAITSRGAAYCDSTCVCVRVHVHVCVCVCVCVSLSRTLFTLDLACSGSLGYTFTAADS